MPNLGLWIESFIDPIESKFILELVSYYFLELDLNIICSSHWSESITLVKCTVIMLTWSFWDLIIRTPMNLSTFLVDYDLLSYYDLYLDLGVSRLSHKIESTLVVTISVLNL